MGRDGQRERQEALRAIRIGPANLPGTWKDAGEGAEPCNERMGRNGQEWLMLRWKADGGELR